MSDPAFEIFNSIATAEGTIAKAIINSPTNLHMSNCLIIGYGKCGIAIASRLKSLYAFTTIFARNPMQLASALEHGHKTIELNNLEQYISKYDFIFNTLPAMILTRQILSRVHSEATIIDIASKPGGTDFEACKHFGINANLCLSLPGKYSPKSSSIIIYNCLHL